KMTELERHLLTAFERLEKSYSEQLETLQNAQNDLQTMFEHTSQENRQLKRQVNSLNEQITALSGQVQQLAKLYSTSRNESSNGSAKRAVAVGMALAVKWLVGRGLAALNRCTEYLAHGLQFSYLAYPIPTHSSARLPACPYRPIRGLYLRTSRPYQGVRPR